MGFFSRKTVVAPAAAQTKAAPKPGPIAITGVGIACHAGDKPLSLICAILGQMNGVRLSKEHQIPSDDGSKVAMARMAPI